MAQTGQTHVPVLEKMEIADILDTAIRLYRHNFLPLLEIIAIPYSLLLAMQLIVSYQFNSLTVSESADIPWSAVATMIPVVLLLIAAWIVLYPLTEGALAFAVSEAYLGRRTSVASAYRRVWPLVWRLLLTMILVFLATSTGTMFCIIPGIVLWIWFILTTPIIALEDTWGTGAVSRSYQLVQGHGWRVFGTYLLLLALVGVATYAIAIPAQFGVLAVAAALGETYLPMAGLVAGAITGVGQIVVRPVLMIAIVLIYYDLRIRKEGFDLVMLAEAMEASSPTGAPAYEPGGFRPGTVELPPQPKKQASLPPRPDEPEEGLPPPPG